MAIKRTKYFVLTAKTPSTGVNFTDFNLAYGSVSLNGQEITFAGSPAIDSIFVRPGITISFIPSHASSDGIYLSGRFSDYSVSLAGTNITIQRGTDATLEKVTFTKAATPQISDRLIFADGTVNSLALYNSLNPTDPTPLGEFGTETSLVPQLSGSLDATIKAFATGNGGDTFAQAKPGVRMILSGSIYVDTVYVADGAYIEALSLKAGKDLIYFRGNWADYTKVVAGTNITFTRTINGAIETVKVAGTASLNDQLIFADGAAGSLAVLNGLEAAKATGATLALSNLIDFDATLRTPGVTLDPVASALDNIVNFDIGSNIVLVFAEVVTAVPGKKIHIVNSGGSGFRGENAVNTLDIAVDAPGQVLISDNKVIINPLFDLDFANTYFVSIDAGAFLGASGKTSSEFDGVSALNFSTVNPGTTSFSLPNVANAAPSVVMLNDGTLGPSFSFLDIEGIGTPSSDAIPIDLGAADVSLVFKDADPAGSNGDYDGIQSGNFNLAVNNFGAGDRIYVDNQSVDTNNLALSGFTHFGFAPTMITFSGADLGGVLYVTAAGSTVGFASVAELKATLGINYDPIVSDGFVSVAADNTVPVISVTTPINVAENITSVATLSANEIVTWTIAPATGLVSADAAFFKIEGSSALAFASAPNFEHAGHGPAYSVRVTATDLHGNSATKDLTVQVTDVNEPVSSLSDANLAPNTVSENSLVGTPVGYKAFALDPDATNNSVTYKLFTSVAADVEFPSNLLRIDSATGDMSVGGPIDYEALPANAKYLSVYVKAMSADGSSTITGSPVTINVSDEPEATVPLTLSSAPIISSNSTTIAGTTTPLAVVKVFIGTSGTAAGQVTADSQGGWSIPIDSTSLVSGTNAFKFTATLGTSFGTLNQNFLYSGAPSWTQGALTMHSIRGAVDQALASDGKITHTEAVAVLNAAIDAATTRPGANGKVGSDVLTDLRAISLRGDGVFTSTDLTGKESGYLSYVFDKIVNTSTANAFYTGGDSTREALGNLSDDSPIADLQKLRDKWLLGLDTPDPRTQGDTANASAAAANGVYAAFNGTLVIDGFNAFDIQQGSMGDCYLLAGAAAIAETETYAKTSSSAQLTPYKNAFEQVFVTNPGAAPTWGVRFFDEFGKAHWVTVNNQLVVPHTGATTPSYAKVVVPAGATQGEIWVPLLEKAYAQANEIGILGRDNSSNAFFAIEGGLGEGIPQLMGGGMAFISAQRTASWSRLYFGLPATEATTASGAGTYEGVSNTGQPLFLASFIQTEIGGKIAFTSGHAYMTYDDARTTASNTTVSVYNPWGPSGSGHVSPFQANLADLKTNPDVMLMFRVSDVPAWVTTAFNNQQAQKAASAAPASVASALQAAVSGGLSGAFLKVSAGASAAYSDNGTLNATSIADDRHGLFTLDGTETGFKVFLLPKTGTSTAGFATLLQSIQGADSASMFSTAVADAQVLADVRFGIPRAQVDITGDATAETGVTVALKYSGVGADGKITFAPLKEIGEVASAKVAGGVSASITHTKPHPEAHAVYFDTQTGAVMFLDSHGDWKVGKFGDPISSYTFLTYENASGTETKINSDTFEAEADAVQFIFAANGTTVVGYELIASSHENPDDLFTLYFDQTGKLAGSEFLSASEELEAEAEYEFDVNGSGGVGHETSFLAEGIGGAPDLYVDPYGDLILASVDNQGAFVVVAPVTIAYDGNAYPLNLYDFEDGIEVTAVVPIPSSTDYLLYLQFGSDAIATVTVHQDGSILLGTGVHEGEIVIGGTLTPEQEAELERDAGIDLGRDGDTDVQAPLVTGDATDQSFDSRDAGTNDWFQDSAGDDTYFTGEGDDLLIGIHSGESNYGTRGDNTFHGGEGDDTFVGIGDGDVFFGGPDTDSVWISGAPDDYSIFVATPSQLAFARSVDPDVATGYVIADIARGALSAVFDVESIEFGFDGTTGLLSNLATNYTHVG